MNSPNLFGQDPTARRGEDDSRIRSLVASRAADEATLAHKVSQPTVTDPVMQAASVLVTTDAGGNVTITFPQAFSVAPQCIVVTNGDRTQGLFWCSIVQTPTTTSFVVRLENSAGAVNTTTVRLNYVAVST